MPKKLWTPALGETYWFFNHEGVTNGRWDDTDLDRARQVSGGVYPSYVEAAWAELLFREGNTLDEPRIEADLGWLGVLLVIGGMIAGAAIWTGFLFLLVGGA
jgi:hypothetical protein